MKLPPLPDLSFGDPRLLLEPAFVPLWAILLLEIAILFAGQRRIAAELLADVPWRPIAYLLIAPGTILHETAHAVMATALLVRVRRFVPFWPTRLPDGGYRFGYILYDRTGAVRATLISAAPLLLVPAVLLGFNALLLGVPLPGDLAAALGRAGAVKAGLWVVMVGLGARSAFPSSHDRLGLLGPILILGLAPIVLSLGVGSLGPAAMADGLQTLLVILAVPVLVNLAMMAALWLI